MKSRHVIFAGILLTTIPAAALGEEAPITQRLIECGEPNSNLSVIKFYTLLNEEEGKNRIITTGKGHEIYIQFNGDVQGAAGNITGNIKEIPRKTLIDEQTRALVEIIRKYKGYDTEAFSKKSNPALCIKHSQLHKRGTIEFDLTQTPTAISTAPSEPVKHKGTILVGPAENWSWSADMPISDIKQLTYDSTTSSVIEKEKPANFYASLNWRYGDIYTDYSWKEYYKSISVKAMVQASSRPTQSLGLGLGLPIPFIDSVPISLFVAHAWTKDDESVPEASLGTTSSTIWGITLDVYKGIAWFKEATKKEN